MTDRRGIPTTSLRLGSRDRCHGIAGAINAYGIRSEKERPEDRRRPIMALRSRLLGLLIVILVATLASAQENITCVASVIDGDTIEIHGQADCHTASMRRKAASFACARRERWRCGQQASLALSDLIGRATVSCQPRDRDRYGRIVAICFKGSEDLNRWMVILAGPSHIGDIL